MRHLFGLDGRIAAVTGASSGIGQAIALKAGQAGATVAGTAKPADPPRKLTGALTTTPK